MKTAAFSCERSTIPALSRLTGLRGALDMLRNPVSHFSGLTRRFGDCFEYPFGGLTPTLVVSRPSIIQHVLQSDADNFPKSDIQTRWVSEFLGSGLLTHQGEAWRNQRRLIVGGLRTERLSRQAPFMWTTVEAALDGLRHCPSDFARGMRELTFAMVAQLMLGHSLDAEDIAEIGNTIARVQAYIVRNIAMPWLSPWYRATGRHAHYQSLRRNADTIVAKVIEARLVGVHDEDRVPDMLDLLLESVASDLDRTAARDAVVAEMMILLVAGHETSATALAWTIWLLARHPCALEAVRKEVDEALGDRLPGTNDVHRLPVCVAALKEAMRLYPPLWLIDRVALRASSVDGIEIPAGMRIAVFVYGAHHRSDFWDSPELFKPERFFGHEKANERSGAFLPFGTGPRTCVGGNYAFLQMLVILAALLRRFEIEADEREIAPRGLLVLRPGDDLRIRLRPRN